MDLEQLIGNYQASEATRRIISKTKIVLLVGISGAGKDTIKRRLLEDSEFRDIVSHTTRAPRRNAGMLETDGIDYHFIDESRAVQMLADQDFIEAKLVHGTVYGTSVAEVAAAHEQNRIAITDVDVQGVDEYKVLSRDVVAIFILPPDFQTWRTRLKARYESEAEFEAEWPKRRASAIKELERALSLPYYHFIINDTLDEAVRVAAEISRKPDVYTRKDDEVRLAARDLLQDIIAHEA